METSSFTFSSTRHRHDIVFNFKLTHGVAPRRGLAAACSELLSVRHHNLCQPWSSRAPVRHIPLPRSNEGNIVVYHSLAALLLSLRLEVSKESRHLYHPSTPPLCPLGLQRSGENKLTLHGTHCLDGGSKPQRFRQKPSLLPIVPPTCFPPLDFKGDGGAGVARRLSNSWPPLARNAPQTSFSAAPRRVGRFGGTLRLADMSALVCHVGHWWNDEPLRKSEDFRGGGIPGRLENTVRKWSRISRSIKRQHSPRGFSVSCQYHAVSSETARTTLISQYLLISATTCLPVAFPSPCKDMLTSSREGCLVCHGGLFRLSWKAA